MASKKPIKVGLKRLRELPKGIVLELENFDRDIEEPIKLGNYETAILRGLIYLDGRGRKLLFEHGFDDKNKNGKRISAYGVFRRLKSEGLIDDDLWEVLDEIIYVRNSFGHYIEAPFFFKKEDLEKVAKNCFPAIDCLEKIIYKKQFS